MIMGRSAPAPCADTTDPGDAALAVGGEVEAGEAAAGGCTGFSVGSEV